MRGTIKPGGIWGGEAGYEADFTKVENTGLWKFDMEDNHDLLILEKEIVFAPTKKEKRVSQEINLEDVQVGDTLVCFWEKNGVEYRQKGVVARIDEDGWAVSEGGNFITHKYATYTYSDPAEHIYLIDSPAKKHEIENGTYWVTTAEGNLWKVEVKDGVADWKYGEDFSEQAYADYEYLLRIKQGKEEGFTFHTTDPTPKGFDALDKTKTYFLKNKNGIMDWFLAYNERRWRYGRSGGISTPAAAFEWDFTSGEGDWEKPVEYTATYAEKHKLDAEKAYVIHYKDSTLVLRFIDGEWHFGANDAGFVRVEADPFEGWSDPVEHAPEPEVEDGFYYMATSKGQLYRALNNKLSVAFDGEDWWETRYIPERFIADIKAGELIRI